MKKNSSPPASGSQVDQCYLILRQLITSCALAPSQRVTERELIEHTGFGRTPVREALLRLSHDGLVTALPRSGYRIAPLDEKAVNDLFDIWRPIGPLIVRSAFRNMTPEVRRKIDALAALPVAKRSQTPAALTQRAADLFSLLTETSQNEHLRYICHRLSAHLYRVFEMFLGTEYGTAWLTPPETYQRLARETDPETAAAYFVEAIRASQQGVMAALRAKTQTQANEAFPGPSKNSKAGAKPRKGAKNSR